MQPLRRTLAAMAQPIERVTMFKIAKKEDREKVLEAYKKVKQTAVKDGKPYILSCEAGHAADEARAQGWTLACKTTFASLQDMEYYDTQCEAHKMLKQVAIPFKEDVMTVWFESAVRD
ncbi:Hypothetical protein R9X50_00612000 [Acrodontium crateriforme]|uniref:Stress-response A/B barrel domain-containing protein n=1 Tax=Acrodontium crateriforme TaxID=150365 RepID=A0AAQ3M9F7_9PEZI|nr:Hypothetical protein R9X50_00612000 [Acrodontium crateriforme]